MYDFAVIGLGLIGSAAFRHPVDMGHRVVGIGPAEPKPPSERDHVFASYYDQGRIAAMASAHDQWTYDYDQSLFAAVYA